MHARMLVAVAALLALPVQAAQMFKCVDEKGTTHYTDKPVPGCKGGPAELKGTQRPSGPIRPPDPRPSKATQDARAGKGAPKESKEQAAARMAAERKARCATLHDLYRGATTTRRGEDATATADAARLQRAAVLKGQIDRDCQETP